MLFGLRVCCALQATTSSRHMHLTSGLGRGARRAAPPAILRLAGSRHSRSGTHKATNERATRCYKDWPSYIPWPPAIISVHAAHSAHITAATCSGGYSLNRDQQQARRTRRTGHQAANDRGRSSRHQQLRPISTCTLEDSRLKRRGQTPSVMRSSRCQHPEDILAGNCAYVALIDPRTQSTHTLKVSIVEDQSKNLAPVRPDVGWHLWPDCAQVPALPTSGQQEDTQHYSETYSPCYAQL